MLAATEHTDFVQIAQKGMSLPNLTSGKAVKPLTQIVSLSNERGKQIRCRIVLDTASQVSLISMSTVKELGLVASQDGRCRISGVGGNRGPVVMGVTDVAIGPVFGGPKGILTVQIVRNICDRISLVTNADKIRKLASYGYCVSDCATVEEAAATEISVLIGVDSLWEYIVGTPFFHESGVILINTLGGWCVAEKEMMSSFANSNGSVDPLILVCSSNNIPSNEEIEKEECDRWMRELEKSLSYRDGRYWVGLPWLKGWSVESNFNAALFRLRKLVARLRADGFYDRYESELRSLVAEGHAERVKISKEKGTYYMPHRAVIREDKETTKVRVVFDASARTKSGSSLNSSVNKGLELNPSIWRMLVGFRCGKVAATADIAKAFLQIRIVEEDRDFLRFLWIDVHNNLVAYRLTSVPFGATCSPFLLAAVLRKHLQSKCERGDLAARLSSRLYVDDLVITTDSREEMRDIHDESVRLFEKYGMNLRKWKSSDRVLNSEWMSSGSSDNTSALTTVLGLKWNVEKDHLSINAKRALPSSWTPRSALAMTNSFFDPLGLFAPVTIRSRILMKEHGVNGPHWDAVLCDKSAKVFHSHFQRLLEIKDISTPRLALDTCQGGCIAIFCDASKAAYGAVAYVCAKPGDTLNLLVSEVHLSPNRSTPELELSAALVGANLYEKLHKEIKPEWVSLLTDASTVLSWLNAHPNTLKNLFVRNRVWRILKKTTLSAWRHIRTQFNPADLLSRGLSMRQFMQQRLWWHGPVLPAEAFISVSVGAAELNNLCLTLSQVDCTNKSWEDLCDAERHNENGDNSLDIRIRLWKLSQSQSFSDEIACLKRKRKVSVKSKLSGIALFLDEQGLLRLYGRTQTTDEDFDNPIVLDAKNNIAHAWLVNEHSRLGHPGVGTLLSHVREHFWYLNLRSVIRRLVARCAHCAQKRAKPSTIPEGMLPKERCDGGDAFRAVGIDFAGPFYLRKRAKRYVLLFTCMASRAVHFEVTTGISTSDVWRAFSMFIARRGTPATVFSDNGLSFVRLNKEIKTMYESIMAIKDCPDVPIIQWKFSTPLSPWQGGFFERMVGVMKKCLMSLSTELGRSDGEFRMNLAMCEAIVNSRPISSGPDGNVITPGHLLIGRRLLSWPALDDKATWKATSINNMVERREVARQKFWKHWRRCYLSALPGRFRTTEKVRNLPIGSSVLYADPLLHRRDWAIAKVINEIPGNDGITRHYTIEVRGKRYERPVQHLIALEGDELQD